MRANFKKHISMVLVLCLAIALLSLASCKDKESDSAPEETTAGTTTESTTTAPSGPVTFPSDEESDPKQEDVFYE